MGKKGWRTVIVNKRGQRNAQFQTPKIVSLTSILDIQTAIERFDKLYPSTSFYFYGVSAGANQLLNYVNGGGNAQRIRAIGIIGNPWDLYKCFYFIQSQPILLYICDFILKKFLLNIKNKSSERLGEYFREIGYQDRIEHQSIGPREFLEEFLPAVLQQSNLQLNRDIQSDHAVEQISHPVLNIHSFEDLVCSKHHIPVSKIHFKDNFINLYFNRGGHIEFFHGPFLRFYAFEIMLDYFSSIETYHSSFEKLSSYN